MAFLLPLKRGVKMENGEKLPAREFNRRLNVPVSWVPIAKATGKGVTHVYLTEALNEGRLQRDAHSHLCTSEKKQIDSYSTAKPGDQPVTCRACLRIARRWMGEWTVMVRHYDSPGPEEVATFYGEEAALKYIMEQVEILKGYNLVLGVRDGYYRMIDKETVTQTTFWVKKREPTWR